MSCVITSSFKSPTAMYRISYSQAPNITHPVCIKSLHNDFVPEFIKNNNNDNNNNNNNNTITIIPELLVAGIFVNSVGDAPIAQLIVGGNDISENWHIVLVCVCIGEIRQCNLQGHLVAECCFLCLASNV